MGIDSQVIRFLLRAKSTASFETFLMLGRQGCHVPPAELEKLLLKNGFAAADINVALTAARNSRFAEPILELLGARKIESLDFSNYEEATIVHDMNQPIPEHLKRRYSSVFDGGTLEHVFNFPQAIENAMEMVAIGGHYIGVTPTNNFVGHGFYQFSPELYWRIFSESNGYELEEMAACENRPGSPFYRIEDPERARRRVQFTSGRPTYLMIRARRLAPTKIFKSIPQQSDYVAIWSPQTAKEGSGVVRESLRNRAKRVLPESVKNVLRPWFPQVRKLRYSRFEKLR